jgi:hypothetical protein
MSGKEVSDNPFILSIDADLNPVALIRSIDSSILS